MKEVRYLKIDAFSSGRSSGNPAGVVFLKGGEILGPEEMQEIARGQKGIVSEVVFCTPKAPSLFSLRYYSSECEVEFCGHGSIACLYTLIKSDPNLADEETILIETRRGTLSTLNDIEGSDSIYITAPSPRILSSVVTRKEIAGSLGIPPENIDDANSIALIDGGLCTLIVPLKKLDDVLNTKPDMGSLAKFCRDNGIDIVLIYCTETFERTNGFRTRVFAPKYGYLEDPATGSGNSALGYHLLNEGQWEGGPLLIEQGPDRERPNIIRLMTVLSGQERRVLFGGNAVVRYEKILSWNTRITRATGVLRKRRLARHTK
jgi:PhzF family phenazine biosynthesis protein